MRILRKLGRSCSNVPAHAVMGINQCRRCLTAVPPERSSTLLYRTHRGALVDYANGIVRDRAYAEDVVQEAWERIQAVERGRTLAEPLRYFYRIVRNLAIDGRRVHKRELERQGAELADISEVLADETPTPEAEVAARDELRIVLESMDELPERSRTALILHTVEGKKLREVAEHLGLKIPYTHQLIAEAKLHCIKRLSRRP